MSDAPENLKPRPRKYVEKIGGRDWELENR